MRISDWSSDVCSSDLRARPVKFVILPRLRAEPIATEESGAIGGERLRRPVDHRLLRDRGLEPVGLANDPARQHAAARAAGDEQCVRVGDAKLDRTVDRSEEHTSELQSLMRISYAVFC